MKTEIRTFKPGDYCRFTPEEIPTIIALLKANGWKIWDRQDERYTQRDVIILFSRNNEFVSVVESHIGLETEIQRHDFMVTALRVNEGDGMRSDMSTPEQRRHIAEVLCNIGIDQFESNESRNFSQSFYFDGVSWIGSVAVGFIKNHIPYSEWCKRLNETPINQVADNNERYPMCEDQPVQMDCRNEGCRFQQKGKCNNVSPAITLNPDGTYVCWTSGMETTNHTPDVGEKVFPSDECNHDSQKWCSNCYEKNRDKLINPSKQTLTLTDGTTGVNWREIVDLTKPLEVSDDTRHFIGLSRKGEFVCESKTGFTCHYQHIRNKPEPEFKPGDKVWFIPTLDKDKDAPEWTKNLWLFGEVIHPQSAIISNGCYFKYKAIRSAFDENGNFVYPPFNN